MSNGITRDNLMLTAPPVLVADDGMNPLAQMIAEALSGLAGKTVYPNLYARIDSLPEDLLDILAKDFKVDWYDYNYSIDTKRAVIKDSFYVHRHLGTKSALKKALSDVYPPSTAEEWFEYGGQPFYFRVLLEASKQREPISLPVILETINLFKSIRSHLQDGKVIVVVTHGITCHTAHGGQKYHPRVCGTVPRAGTHGNVTGDDVIVETGAIYQPYTTPLTGQSVSGQYPRIGTHGDAENGDMSIGIDAGGSLFSPRPCGTPGGSLM